MQNYTFILNVDTKPRDYYQTLTILVGVFDLLRYLFQSVSAANTDCICRKYTLYMPQIQKPMTKHGRNDRCSRRINGRRGSLLLVTPRQHSLKTTCAKENTSFLPFSLALSQICRKFAAHKYLISSTRWQRPN